MLTDIVRTVSKDSCTLYGEWFELVCKDNGEGYQQIIFLTNGDTYIFLTLKTGSLYSPGYANGYASLFTVTGTVLPSP